MAISRMTANSRMMALAAASAVLGLALAACDQTPPAPKPGDTTRATLPGADAQARKAGLWEQKVSNGVTSQVTRLCLDAAAHSSMAYLGASLNAPCKSHTMTPSPDGSWTFSSVCTVGGVEVATNGSATGDFTKGYQIRMESVAPGQPPQRYVVDAAWKGPCPGDMIPGDIIGADGQKHRIAELKVGSTS